MVVGDLRCACGSDDLIAVAPGSAPERVLDLFTVRREVPVRAFCLACWPVTRETKEHTA